MKMMFANYTTTNTLFRIVDEGIKLHVREESDFKLN